MSALNTYAMYVLVAMRRLMDGEFRREEGQTMAEYGLILAGIAVIVMTFVLVLGNKIGATFTSITNLLG